MSNTNITTTTETTTVVVEENIVRIELNNIGVQGVPGANNDPVYVTVRNATGSLITKGSIVYVSGGNGTHTQVTKALATSDATSARVLGWLAADIANNADGLCMVEGYLDGVDTQGVTEGAQLYLSGTTAGAYQVTKPVAPIHLVYVGVAVKASAGNGRVYVKVQNGYELNELHDVLITAPTNNQVLAYDSATSLWKNATNAPDGVTSITAVSPLTGGTITSTGSIGLDQTALSITKSQVSDFTSGTVTSASTAQQAGTAVYAVNSGTAVYSTTSGTAVYSANSGTAVTISGTITKSQVSDFTSGTVAQADNATNAGTSVYATNSGTAVYADTSGTATYATNAGTAVFATTSGTATFATNSGTAVFATNASTAVSVSGSAITQSQVVNLVSDLAGKANLAGGNAFTGAQTIATGADANKGLTINSNGTAQSAALLDVVGTTAQTTITGAGLFTTTASVQTTGIRNPSVVTVLSFNTAGINVLNNNSTAANVGQVVRGAASQSANLLQLQNSSAGVVASFSAPVNNVSRLNLGGTDLSATLGITVHASGGVGQVIRGAASQSADLLQLQNSAGTNLVRADQFGGLFSTYANFTSDAAGTLPLRVRGASGQTADLTQWQNSGGTVLSEITSTGSFYVNTNNNTTGIEFLGNAGTQFISANGNDLGVRPRFDLLFSPADSSGRLRPSNDNTSDLGTSGQRWKNVFASGMFLTNSTAANIPLTITGASAQTADLLLLRNNGLTTQFRVDPNGMTIANSLGVAGSPSGISYAYFTTPSASSIPVVVRGAASQTANLQEWQNSAGTVLARVDSGGNLKASNVATLNSLIQLAQANSGGVMIMGRSTAQFSSPGNNSAALYFRDGTNAGTLKLVVRAGAAGAETTILDNIPQ